MWGVSTSKYEVSSTYLEVPTWLNYHDCTAAAGHSNCMHWS